MNSLLSALLCIALSLGVWGCSTDNSTSIPAKSIQYSISGKVHDPGVKTGPQGITTFQAIATARLHTFGCRYVQVIRDGSATTIRLRDFDKDPTKDILLKDGDSIIILGGWRTNYP